MEDVVEDVVTVEDAAASPTVEDAADVVDPVVDAEDSPTVVEDVAAAEDPVVDPPTVVDSATSRVARSPSTKRLFSL